MDFGTICMIETGVILVLIVLGGIAALLILISHELKKKEAENAVTMMKQQLFPEMEAMINRMMANIVETTMKASTDMMKRLEDL